jgi:hypothetical protein
LRSHTASEKLLKIPLFGPSLINQLRLLGSQQHPPSGFLLNSFSSWGTENSLVEINLESAGGGGVMKVVTFFGVKNRQMQLCGQAHYRATRKKSQEQNAAGRTS